MRVLVTWESLVDAMVQESGGTAHGTVESEEDDLDGDQAGRVEDWVKALIADRKRSQHRASGPPRREHGKGGVEPGPREVEATL